MRAFLFDSNTWVALTFEGHVFHTKAKAVLSEIRSGDQIIICQAIELSWLRLITTSAVQKSSRSSSLHNAKAIALVESWLDHPQVKMMNEPSGTRALWLQLADLPTASPKRWMDAYLAAFAISGNLRFVTADKDFRQFETAGLDLHLLTA